MHLAADYPLLDVVWTMIAFFAWFILIWLLIVVYGDLFGRDDVGGWGKTGWVLFTLFLPFLGVFTYLIVQGRRMAERNIDRAAQRQRGLDQYIRTVSASSHTSGLEEIAKAQELLDSGAITREEFEVMKRRVLSSA
jgi:hypothetical protein